MAKPHGALAGPLLYRYQLGASKPPVPVPVLTLLSIHSELTSMVVELLCIANSFAFPDSLTLSSFVKQTIGAMCALHIRRVSLDSCDVANITQARLSPWGQFEDGLDLSIADEIRLLPALTELTLGGIGPETSWPLGSQPVYGAAIKWGKSGQYWRLRDLDVLRKIVGGGTLVNDVYAPGCALDDVDQNATGQNLMRGPLEGGRIVYWARTTSEMPMYGMSRYMGVRILKQGTEVKLAASKFVKEEELTDLDTLMQEVVDLHAHMAREGTYLIPQWLRDVMEAG